MHAPARQRTCMWCTSARCACVCVGQRLVCGRVGGRAAAGACSPVLLLPLLVLPVVGALLRVVPTRAILYFTGRGEQSSLQMGPGSKGRVQNRNETEQLFWVFFLFLVPQCSSWLFIVLAAKFWRPFYPRNLWWPAIVGNRQSRRWCASCDGLWQRQGLAPSSLCRRVATAAAVPPSLPARRYQLRTSVRSLGCPKAAQ